MSVPQAEPHSFGGPWAEARYSSVSRTEYGAAQRVYHRPDGGLTVLPRVVGSQEVSHVPITAMPDFPAIWDPSAVDGHVIADEHIFDASAG